MASKVKGRDEKSKNSKGLDENEELDLALLRKPITTSITGLAQAKNIFDLATEELKDLLANECDLLYECKVCRNLFRSLANLISHKRVYCREKFNSSIHGHFVKVPTAANEMQKIMNFEDSYQNGLHDIEDDCDRIPMTKDLTTIIEKMSKNKALSIFSNNSEITLRKIPSSSIAVFQNIKQDNINTDNMQAEVTEISEILSRDKAVLQSNGKFKIQSHVNFDKLNENVIQISDDEDGNLKCKICHLKFSTVKTMKFHMKYKHLESRLVYPCPDCLEIFSTSWSVYRHLFKVHRKSAAQIRKLREAIQAKAFKLNNPPAFYEKHKNKSSNKQSVPNQNMTEEERLDQENQEWMDKLECDGSVPRCGGCGRTFERRAALAAHTHTCQPRSKALARKTDAKRIEIQVRKDYMKMPTGKVLSDCNESNESPNEKTPEKEEQLENDNDETDEVNVQSKGTSPMDQDERENESVSPLPYQYIMDDIVPSIQLPFAQQIEKSNMASLKQKIVKDIVLTKLLCKKCSEKFDNIQKLYDHMASHYKWMRYACKLCNFKHYSFDKLPIHVKEVHKLKGDSDFYFSTVKAIDGPEALELIQTEEQSNEHEVSSDSRRPSSDSSRISEDSSPVSTRVESSKKRKTVPTKLPNIKRRKDNDGEDDASIENGDTDSVLSKTFDENSSDMDDIEERIQKRTSLQEVAAPYRRPVRKRTMPKNADFEYDLSNLLKMEAQGYREGLQNPLSSKVIATSNTVSKSTTLNTLSKTASATNTKIVPSSSANINNKPIFSQSVSKVSTPHTNTSSKSVTPALKTPLTKDKKERKSTTENNTAHSENTDYAILVKQCSGALTTLTRKSVQRAQAHLKTSNVAVTSKRANIFMRPRDLIPKILARGDKASPVKQVAEEVKLNDTTTAVEDVKEQTDTEVNSEPLIKVDPEENIQELSDINTSDDSTKSKNTPVTKSDSQDMKEPEVTTGDDKEQATDGTNVPQSTEKVRSSFNIPSVTTLNLRNESIEKVMSNPILNKNITELKKAGLKTKILVIKPINRNKDGSAILSSQLKIQTIKLKDPNKTSNEETTGDQVLFVKVPKVDCSVKTTMDKNVVGDKTSPDDTPKTAPSDAISTINDFEKSDNIKEETAVQSIEREEVVNSINELKETNIATNCESSDISDGEDDASIENGDTDSVLSKTFDENSSDMDDIEERIQKRTSLQEVAAPYRRPVRKRTMPKNADFEYDLSNLLKMEAQGYREGLQNPLSSKVIATSNTVSKSTTLNTLSKTASATNTKIVPSSSANINNKPIFSQSVSKVSTPQTNTSSKSVTPALKTPLTKDKKERKSTTENNTAHSENTDYAILVKQCSGALTTLTRKSVQRAQAHLKTSNVAVTSKRANIFMRPRDLIPKILARGDKASPVKQVAEEVKLNDTTTAVEDVKEQTDTEVNSEPLIKVDPEENIQELSDINTSDDSTKSKNTPVTKSDSQDMKEPEVTTGDDKEQATDGTNVPQSTEKVRSSFNIPSVTTLNLRNESIEKVMSNPILNKNITELKKAGLKTKILVIKPINRNKDGSAILSSQLKIQTIKLKDPNKTSNEETTGDQVLFVKVPKVDCSVKTTMDKNVVGDKTSPDDTPKTAPSDAISTINDFEKSDNIKEETAVQSIEREEVVNSINELKETNIATNCESSDISGTILII